MWDRNVGWWSRCTLYVLYFFRFISVGAHTSIMFLKNLPRFLYNAFTVLSLGALVVAGICVEEEITATSHHNSILSIAGSVGSIAVNVLATAMIGYTTW